MATLNDEDPDRMLPKEASMVKLFVRSTLVSTVYGGTSEIQRGIIAKALGL